jgi:uroporphyrinogen-III synthase
MTDPRPPLLLTRPRAQSDRFAAAVRARLGALPLVISPLLEIAPRPDPVPEGWRTAVLTSENGARALAARTDVEGRRAYCVGDRTAAAARAAGMRAVSAGGAAEDLLALLRRAAPEGPLLFARGAETRGGVAEGLAAAGFTVLEAVLYDQRPRPLIPEARALLERPGRVVAPLFSPRSAALLARAARGTAAQVTAVALSPAVAEAWGRPAEVAARPEAAAILDRLAGIYSGPSP